MALRNTCMDFFMLLWNKHMLTLQSSLVKFLSYWPLFLMNMYVYFLLAALASGMQNARQRRQTKRIFISSVGILTASISILSGKKQLVRASEYVNDFVKARKINFPKNIKGDFLGFFLSMYDMQHCIISAVLHIQLRRRMLESNLWKL